MFSPTNTFQIENSEVNKLSESKKNTEQIKNTIEHTKVPNPNKNNNDNISTIVIKPNHDIPKTVYYKRMCQKLAQQNYTIEPKNQTEQIESTNTTDKITQDKNEELYNDENPLKEISTSLIHNESVDVINSTLIIFEPDITPSDYEHDTTQVIQCDNQEKNKENVSIDSFCSKLKQPTKLKKKLIITPATIGVQNTHTKTLNCDKKINQINGLPSIIQSEITNSPEKLKPKSLNKDTLSTSIENNFPECDAKIEDKPFTTDIHNQQLFTSEKKNQSQSINIEVEQFPIRRKKKVIEKDSNTFALINMKNRSQTTVTCLDSSNDNEFNKSIENVKCLSTNNDRESSSPSQQKNNQSKCNLNILGCANSISESKHLNNSSSSSKNTPIKISPTNKSVLSSTNIENKQVPITRKTIALKRNNYTLNKSNKVTQESSIKDHKNKYDSNTNDIQLSTDTLHNQKLSTYDNKKQILSNNTVNRFKKTTQEPCIKNHKNKYDSKMDDKQLSKDILCNQKLLTCEKINQNKVSSINIEVEQFPIRRRKTVIEKDSNCIDLSNVRKRSCVTYMSSTIDNDFNKSTENVKFLNNDKEPSSPSQQNNNQSKCNVDTLKCANSITESKHLNDSCKSSPKNTSVELSPTNKAVIPSINIEVEQGFVFRHSNRRKVIIRSSSDDKPETKKGRRVQLITIEDRYSKPVPSFNGAKKTEIDVSKNSILSEKVVESSSHFYIPQVKRRRTMNFGSADS
ncbi:hypothetical protein ACI65C_010939 [Semiaphis heraclei]